MGSLVTTTVDYFGRIPHNRIITGLLYVIVRNSTGKDDFVDACFENWDPQQANGGATEDIPAELMTSTPFINAGSPVDDPAGGDAAGQLRTGRNKSIGDYDVCCFHVTSAASLGDAVPITSDSSPPIAGGGTNTENHYWTTGELRTQGMSNEHPNKWADSWVHPKCQSFVRHTLLSRHNKSYGHSTDYWDYSASGMERTRYFHDSDPASGQTPVAVVYPYTSNAQTDLSDNQLSTDSMINTGKYDAGSGTNLSFGSDLSAVTSNTWFSPLADVDIFGYHAFNASQNSQSAGDPRVTVHSAPSHNVTSYDLVVRLKLFSYTTSGTTYVDFENRVNIFFQPFGETAQVKFDASSHSS